MPVEVRITVPVFRTEMMDRVRRAVLNLFPDAAVEVRDGSDIPGGSVIHANATDLEMITTKLRDQKIRDTARSIFRDSVVGNDICFYLNKQAAFAGKVNFTEGDSLLGDIEVRMRSENPGALIDKLTSKEGAE